VPSRGKAFEQSGQSLARVLIAIVVGREIREKE
jgi:hypothetical protein